MRKNKKIVVVWGNESILSSSIKHLLADKEDLQVISILTTEDLFSLIQRFENMKTDIVIIHQRDREGISNLPLQLLGEHAYIKVITISLENNVMNIYNKQSFVIKEASDLVDVIENVSSSKEIIIQSSWR